MDADAGAFMQRSGVGEEASSPHEGGTGYAEAMPFTYICIVVVCIICIVCISSICV